MAEKFPNPSDREIIEHAMNKTREIHKSVCEAIDNFESPGLSTPQIAKRLLGWRQDLDFLRRILEGTMTGRDHGLGADRSTGVR
jgi:hypothetical protein